MSDQEETKEICRDVGALIAKALPPGVAFALVLADVGESGWMTYIGNVQRADILAMLKELTTKLEQGTP